MFFCVVTGVTHCGIVYFDVVQYLTSFAAFHAIVSQLDGSAPQQVTAVFHTCLTSTVLLELWIVPCFALFGLDGMLDDAL